MKGFIKFFIVWVSQNLSIPFWVVGHVHLSIRDYRDDLEVLSSVLLHVVVAVGFVIDYRMNKSEYQ